MCVTLTEGLSKKCSCKFAHLCKRNHTLETLQEKLEINSIKQGIFNTSISPLAFNYAEVNKHSHAQKGSHL